MQHNVAGMAFGVSVLALGLLHPAPAHAQGCIAIRGTGMCMRPGHHHPVGAEAGDNPIAPEHWQVALSYRWLHSDRHFVGDEEQKQRQRLGTEVINDSHFIDLGVSYYFNPRFSANLTLPFVYSDRSSYYEHSGGSPATGGTRYHTQAGGLGDARITGNVWLWDPVKMPKGNLQLGLGLKGPSGDYKAKDTFYTPRGPEEHYVDQSIQPGDGGWGFTLEMYAYREIFKNTAVYLQGFYLFNPENVNGVSSRAQNPRGKTIEALNRTINNPNASQAARDLAQARLNNATALGYNNPHSLEDVMSITDQFLGRAGLTYMLVPSWGLALNLGGRIEGVPVRDALGNSDGFRRPGYTVSIEPGISMSRGRFSAELFAPVALYRNRTVSIADKRWQQITPATEPVPGGGDAAFADFLIAASFAVRF